jgi:hypothetical protein
MRNNGGYLAASWRLPYVKLALVNGDAAKVKRRKTPWVVGTLMVASLALLVILQSTNLWKEFFDRIVE